MVYLNYQGSCRGMLFDASHPPPVGTFDGYALKDSDLIIGGDGRRKYFEETGNEILDGEDGTYFCAVGSPDGLRLGTDAAGNYPLFLYRHNSYWAVSSSFCELVRFVTKQRRPLTLLQHLLDAWLIPRPLFRQPISWRTVVGEISVVGARQSLCVAGGGNIEIVAKTVEAANSLDYRQRLNGALRVTLGRIRTVSQASQLTSIVDLSGGLDSRAVFSHFSFLRRMGVLSERDLANSIHTGAAKNRDSIVAGKIRERLHVGAADEQECASRTPYASSELALEAWRIVNLGVHGQFRSIPNELPDLRTARFSGGGGENYRPFYSRQSPAWEYFSNFTRFASLSSANQFFEEFSQVHSDLANSQPDLAPAIAHYREFRSRFHSGVKSLIDFKFKPLSWKAFAGAFDRSPANRKANLIHDVIASLDSELLKVEFDLPAKSLSNSEAEAVIRVVPEVQGSGKIFGSPPMSEGAFSRRDRSLSNRQVFMHMRDTYQSRMRLMEKQDVPRTIVRKGQRLLEGAADRGNFANSEHSTYFHYSELLSLLHQADALGVRRRSLLDKVISMSPKR